uniref:PDZ domain-containing protein n=1 Tax=Echinostoma caproni TaxID=27848 RepID=A0A183B6W3_9TREM
LEVHHVMPNGRVAREGFLAVGDRILSIDGVSLIGVPFEQGRDLFQAALKKPELTLQIQRKSARLSSDDMEKKKSALPSCRLIIVPDMSEKAKEAEALSARSTSKPAPPPPPRRSPNTVLTRIPAGIIPPLIEEFLQEHNRVTAHSNEPPP